MPLSLTEIHVFLPFWPAFRTICGWEGVYFTALSSKFCKTLQDVGEMEFIHADLIVGYLHVYPDILAILILQGLYLFGN